MKDKSKENDFNDNDKDKSKEKCKEYDLKDKVTGKEIVKPSHIHKNDKNPTNNIKLNINNDRNITFNLPANSYGWDITIVNN